MIVLPGSSMNECGQLCMMQASSVVSKAQIGALASARDAGVLSSTSRYMPADRADWRPSRAVSRDLQRHGSGCNSRRAQAAMGPQQCSDGTAQEIADRLRQLLVLQAEAAALLVAA